MAAARIGFIGAGQMANALAKGFVNAGKLNHSEIMMFDPSEAALKSCESFGFRIASSNQDLVARSEIVFLAVKPQCVHTVVSSLQGSWGKGKLLVSICAGITIDYLSKCLGSTEQAIIRVMPNTPCLIGQSASAFCTSAYVSNKDFEFVQSLLETVGIVHQVLEDQLEAVTGLSGSGPAYIYTLIEALSDAGVERGLARNVATSLATQTVLGSACMVKETGTHPAVLRESVTSPGGTTIAGVVALEAAGFRHAVISAVNAATDRAKQLGQEAKHKM